MKPKTARAIRKWRNIKADPVRLAARRLRVAAQTKRTYYARKADPIAYGEHLAKCRARNAVKRAVAAGRLVRALQCEACGACVRTEAHHTDYTKRLVVKWLCRPCHGDLHREERGAYATAR